MEKRKTQDIVFDSDYLGFSCVKEILQIIKEEKLLFSDKIIKINKMHWSQLRNIIITDKAIYNLKKMNLKRRIPLNIISGITVSTITDEFVIHGTDKEYDYDYISEKRKEIIRIISEAYYALTSNDILLCQLEAKSLSQFVTLKKEKHRDPNFSRMQKKYATDINAYLSKNRDANNGESSTVLSNHKTVKEVKLEDFQVLRVIGRGSFGKVCVVEYIPNHEIYAMKSLKKDILIEQDQIENTLLEKEILQNIDHPFLCGLIFCFQTQERIYFVMPFLNGGELFQHLRKFRFFDEEKVRFYGAQIAMALQYLHDKGIVYRDLKPENILMDDMGYLRLADFGMAKKLKGKEKAMSFCGTPEYLAPEIITGEGHDKSADWWSFGVLLYEMLCGIPPFYVENVEKMYELIKSGPLKFPKKSKISDDAKNIISKFLDRKPSNRLGYKNGLQDIKSHPFFVTIDFDLLIQKKLPAPFIPNLESQEDVKYFDDEFTHEELGMSYIPKKNIEIIKANQSKFVEFSK